MFLIYIILTNCKRNGVFTKNSNFFPTTLNCYLWQKLNSFIYLKAVREIIIICAIQGYKVDRLIKTYLLLKLSDHLDKTPEYKIEKIFLEFIYIIQYTNTIYYEHLD